MVKRAARYLIQARKQLFRYAVVGTSGFGLDFLTLAAFKELVGLSPTIAVVCNQAITLTYNFTLNKHWSFESKTMPHKQLVRYLTLATWNYVFSVGAMYVLNELFGVHYLLARMLSVMVMVSWNFLLYRHWVYIEKTPGENDIQA
jgi:dolichol-phosphate mannosyltransferase